jgi:hypothetical protein
MVAWQEKVNGGYLLLIDALANGMEGQLILFVRSEFKLFLSRVIHE